jgi:hypothetical protein
LTIPPVLAGEGVGALGACPDLRLLGPPCLLGYRLGVLVVEERLKTPPGVVLGQHGRSGLVSEVAVLDAAHPGPDGLSDGPRCVGMSHHVGSPVLSGLDRGPQLGLGVLGDVDVVVPGGDAATGHELDL